jgi:hypothetical protein
MQFRKLAAIGGAALMAGMSFAAPALAAVTNVADIGNLAGVTDSTAVFPTFYVGADAAPSDVNAAINLAAYMAGNVFTSKTVTVAGAATPADGTTLRTELGFTVAKTKDFDLSGTLVLSPLARSGRAASFLKEATVSVGGTEYKYYETLELTSAPKQDSTGYNLTLGDSSTSTTYETGMKDVGLFVGTGSDIKYRLLFDTALPYGTNLTGKSLTFLGQTYTITGTPSATEMKLSPSAGGQFIPYQQSATLGGFTVKVTAIGAQTTDSVGLELSAGGETKSLSLGPGESTTVTVGGQSTTVSVVKTITGTGGGAEILVGATALVLKDNTEVKDTAGNVVPAFKNWVATMGTSAGAYTHINLTYSRSHNSFNGDTPALLKGQAITGPNNFFVLKNSGLETRSNYKLTFKAVSQSDLDSNNLNGNENGIILEARDDTGALIKVFDVGTGFASTMAWDNDALVWRYRNASDGWSSFTSSNTTTLPLIEGNLQFSLRNTSDLSLAGAQPVNSNLTLVMTEPTLTESTYAPIWRLEFNDAGTGSSRFADVATGSDTDTYMSYKLVSVALGKTDGSNIKSRTAFWSNYGTSIVSAGQSEVSVLVPKQENYVDILFGREAGTGGGGSVITKEPVRLTGDYAKLDTEVADWSKITTDAVVVGGPAVNQAAAKLLGLTYPTKGVASTIPENAALIQVFQNAFSSGKVAVLVAGFEAADTDLAVSAITAGKVTQTAAKVTVSGTVAAPVVTAA